MGVNSLRKTVTRQRRACDFWTHALLRMSPVSCVLHRSGTVQVNLSRPTDSGSTENARLENRQLFKILFKLLYLRFPPLQIRTCVFRTCVFSRPLRSHRSNSTDNIWTGHKSFSMVRVLPVIFVVRSTQYGKLKHRPKYKYNNFSWTKFKLELNLNNLSQKNEIK